MESRTVLERVAASVGMLGLFAVLPFYISSGLAAPLWAIIVLLAFWLLLMVTGIRWFTTRPWLVLLFPVVAFAVWFAAITLGEQVLGWQA